MKRWITLLLCGLLVGCASRPPTEHSAEMVQNMQQASSVEDEKPPSALIVDVAVEAPEEALRKVAEACGDLIAKLPIQEGTPYCPLSREELEALRDCVAETGVPVCAEGYDMRNYEQVAAFAEKVKSGENVQTGIFSVSEYGLQLETFTQNDGLQMRMISTSYFPCTQSVSGELEETTGIALRSSGYLMYGEPDPDGINDCGGYRVMPLGEEKREACRKYVRPVFYSAGKLSTVDWDEKNLSGLNMQFVFETLYQLDTGTELYDADYPQNSRNFTYSIPADEVERIMTKYLPVTVEQLRADSKFDLGQAVYHWGCFAGGGYAPTPQVTEIAENADGTVTLTVASASVQFGQDSSGHSLLTLKIENDGSFRYMSNRLLPQE